MELNVGILLHSHLECIRRLSQEHIAAVLVLGKIEAFAHLEIGELLLIVARDPCSLVKRDGLITAGGVVLMQQTVLDDLKLQLTHRTNDLSSRHLTREELRHTLIGQLFQALGQLLRLHRVSILHITELLGRKTRDAFVIEDEDSTQVHQ